MGTCCQATSNSNDTSKRHNSRQKKQLLSSRLSQDPNWKSSWAGKVYAAIGKLHSQPQSFISMVDRVESDLVPEAITPEGSKSSKIIACLKSAKKERQIPTLTSLAMQILKSTSFTFDGNESSPCGF